MRVSACSQSLPSIPSSVDTTSARRLPALIALARVLLSVTFLCLCPMALPAQSVSFGGHGPAVNFGNLNLCAPGHTTPAPCSETVSLTYNVTAGGTLGTPMVLTLGAPNLDFTLATGSTCTGSVTTGSTCTVKVKFAPIYAGSRHGAVEITDGSGNLLATTLIYGVGTGPQIGFSPGTQVVLPFTGLSGVHGAVMDGFGNVFVGNLLPNTILEMPAGGGATITLPFNGLEHPWGIALDGAGNLFVADQFGNGGSGRVVELLQGASSQITLPFSGLNVCSGVAVDGAGDVFASDTDNNQVVELPAGGGAQITLPFTGIYNPLGLWVDDRDNVFVAASNTSDNGGGDNNVAELPSGGASTWLPFSGLDGVQFPAADPAGNIFTTDYDANALVELPAGVAPQTASPLINPMGVAVDSAADLLVFTSDPGGTGYVGEWQRSQSPPLKFGKVAPGSTATLPLTIINTGTSTLTFTAISNNPQFAIVTPEQPACLTGITPAQTCTLQIAFSPTEPGSQTGLLTFQTNGTTSPAVSLQGSAAGAPAATMTALEASPDSVAMGKAVALTATVTEESSSPVLQGTVTFYDGTKSLGSAQIVSLAGGTFAQGRANLKTASLTPGDNSVIAVFAGTDTDAPSTSAAKNVTVTGKIASITTLSAAQAAGQYTLTAALKAFGTLPPTGSIDFLDTTTNTTLGTVPLGSATWLSSLFISSMPEVGGDPGGLVAGDFDGDGFLDLATANNAGGISVLIGNGDGTFKPQVTYGAGGFPANIYTGDFNNDGKLDLAVVNYFDGAVGILLGNGDGTFQPQTDHGSVNGAVDAKIADFDGDGNLDFVVTDRYGNDVAVLLGNGNGTFQPQKTYATLSGPWSPVVGDLNGDGIPDMLVTAGNKVSELIGKGDGTFNPMTVLLLGPTGNGPYMTLGDLNGDGKLDVVLGNNQQNTVTVSLGNGNGTFQTTQIYPVGSAPGQPVIIDINQDGKPDIAVTSQNDNNIEVLLNKGDGTFQPAVIYVTTSVSPNFMVGGDFNGDARPDLVASTSAGSVETVMLNRQTASVQLPNVAPPASGSELVQAKYSGDATFAKSTSNDVTLEPIGIDFAGGFAGASDTLQINGSSTLDGSLLLLTTDAKTQAGSAFVKTPQNVLAFTTDFTFQVVNPAADGFTFTIQNQDASAVGGIGGGLGYYHIAKSVAIKFDLFNNLGEGSNSTGLYTDGSLPAIPALDLTPSGIKLHSQDLMKAHITYDGVNLTMTLTDTATLRTWSHAWTINIPSTVGGSTAYIGFTAATGSETSTEIIASWTYLPGTPAPNYPAGFEPTGLSLTGSAVLEGAQLQLTSGTRQHAGSTFYTTPQDIQTFTNDFTFQIANPNADGFTFTLQNEGPDALGGIGGSLGYRGISKSVAIKFDLYDNIGEGSDSTGLYTDGALPATPSVDLTGTGINLHSQDVFKAHITYDGTNLAMALTDTKTNATWTHSWTINIASTVGVSTAYVGFTGATGGLTSTQLITAWTYLPGTP